MPNSAKNQAQKVADAATASTSRPTSSVSREKWLELNLKQAVSRATSAEEDSLLKLSNSKWPLIIDKDERAQAFFRHNDLNCLNCMDPETMKPERLRKAIIGSIRTGKPLVLDFMENDGPLLESFKNTCNMLGKDLFDHLTQRTLVNDEKNYLYLAKPEQDGKEYEAAQLTAVASKFKVIYCTSSETPSPAILKISVPVKVV